MISKLTSLCCKRYKESKCWICSYRKHCPHDCGKCLHYIHTPSAAPAPRKYDCGHMMDYYVCKYSHKYMSELCYALKRLKDVREVDKLKILSVGCGPCTDLMAIEHLWKNGDYKFSSLDYRGVEINPRIWDKIYDDIRAINPDCFSFSIIDRDICKYVDELLEEDWHPNLIILQYVFSDMQKHSLQNDINHMISAMGQFIDSCSTNTYIICNDINLSKRWNGGREFFDDLYNGITSDTKCRRMHFNNSNKTGHYNYGDEYPSNELVITPPQTLELFEPYTSCTSAQMIIKKVT